MITPQDPFAGQQSRVLGIAQTLGGQQCPVEQNAENAGQDTQSQKQRQAGQIGNGGDRYVEHRMLAHESTRKHVGGHGGDERGEEHQ
ncbi:MAG: hypothetical protein R3F36_04875 [Candidatus Competibacteraceae bacterium]